MELQLKNAQGSITVMLLGSETLLSEVQALNAARLMTDTPKGIVMSSSELHPEKAYASISSMLLGRFILTSCDQYLKVASLIFLRLLGKTTLVKNLQS